MPEHSYSGASIHLPENTALVKRLRGTSFLLGLVVFVAALIVIVGWALEMPDLKKLWIEKNDVSIYHSVSLLLCALPLLVEDFFGKTKISKRFVTILFTACSLSICAIALVGVNGQSAAFISGGTFFIGLSYLFTRLKILHRFHTAQLMVFVVAVFYMTLLLSLIYRTFAGIPSPHFIRLAPSLTVLFTILCNALLLHWPNRGFVGIFTTSSTSSTLSLRLLLLSVLSVPLLGLVGLIWGQSQSYYSYEIVIVVAILLMVFLALFAWMNVKALYGFEMEHFLMKEALRVNNISLTIHQEDSTAKIVNLEKTKKQFEDKLNNQSSLSDIVEGTG